MVKRSKRKAAILRPARIPVGNSWNAFGPDWRRKWMREKDGFFSGYFLPEMSCIAVVMATWKNPVKYPIMMKQLLFRKSRIST